MKRPAIILTTAVLGLTLTACSPGEPAAGTTTQQTQKTAPVQEQHADHGSEYGGEPMYNSGYGEPTR